MNQPIKVFLSYSHQDDELRKELSSHLSSLANEKLIEPWHDRNIDAGSSWANEIDQNLAQAEIILLLVSSDFINSRYCYSIEMEAALTRHKASEVQVIPVIIRDCDWTRSPLGQLQAIPRDNQAVASGRDKYARDTLWLEVVKEIGKVAEQIRDLRVADFTAQQQAEAGQRYRSQAEEYYQDGFLSPAEMALLKKAGLGEPQAEAILQELQATYQQHQSNLEEYRQVLVAEWAEQESLSANQRSLLQDLQTDLGVSNSEAEQVEQKVLAEKQAMVKREQNLRRFGEELQKAVNAEYPLNNYVESGLDNFQQSLMLTDVDVAPVKANILAHAEAALQEDRQKRFFDFEVITVDEKGQEKSRTTKTAEFVDKNLGDQVILSMVKILGGSFQMGSLPGEGADDELPQHTVQVPEFWMGKYPVTQAQWRFVAALPREKIKLEAKPSRFDGDNRPVERVSWHQSVEFCQRLSRKTGNEYRLPSEAEWEYACRAKTLTKFYFGDVLTPKIANFSGNVGETTNVGIYKPSVFGLYDMHGNVWEWCSDNYFDNYKNAPFDGSACIDSDNENNSIHVLRGGSWFDGPDNCRSAYRVRLNFDLCYDDVGFRVVYAPARTS
jgi:formylglycine-generating enzyme required for sulfatase activity